MASHKTFTEEEKSFLRNNYSYQSWDYLIEEIYKISSIRRSKQELISEASILGVKRTNVRHASYSKEDDDEIRKVYENSSDHELEKNLLILIQERFPDRSLKSIQTHASKIGIRMRKPWSEADISFVKTNYYNMTTLEMAKQLGRTSTSVYNMVRKLKLHGAPMSQYRQEDIDFITNNYLQMTDREIGEILHRKDNCIKEFRRKLNLQRPRSEDVIYGLDKYIHRHNAEWKKSSAENCGYKCIITGEEFDDIHHLYAKNLIIKELLELYPEYRDINLNEVSEEEKVMVYNSFVSMQSKYPLGVCLKEEYHKMFHQKYGFGNNTPEQFYEFVKEVAPERLDYIMNL